MPVDAKQFYLHKYYYTDIKKVAINKKDKILWAVYFSNMFYFSFKHCYLEEHGQNENPETGKQPANKQVLVHYTISTPFTLICILYLII